MFGINNSNNFLNERVENWVKSGIITEDQSLKIRKDIEESRKDSDSNRLVLVISGIGALLLLAGMITFLTLNWDDYSIFLKVGIFVFATLLSFSIGYFFKYVSKNYVIVGTSLIFLGSLLFGGTMLQLSQYYNESSDYHIVILIWLLGVLPVVYLFESTWTARLSSILFGFWFFLYFENVLSSSFYYGESLFAFINFYLLVCLFVMLFGYLNYFTKYYDIGRIFRIDGLIYSLISLFILGIFDNEEFTSSLMMEASNQVAISFLVLFLLNLIISVVVMIKNPLNSETIKFEIFPVILINFISLISFFTQFESKVVILAYLYNILFASVGFLLLYIGYSRGDNKVFNLGITCTIIYILNRYFTWFFEIFDGTLFFILGGIILILLGIVVEKVRKNFKEKNAINQA